MSAPVVVARARAVSKTYGERLPEPVRAVQRVDLELRTGQVTLITGASGSGKTTLLSLIGGLIPPSSGEIELGGTRLTGLSQGTLTELRRRTVGYVFQAFRLIDALSVIENVEVVLNIAGVTRPASRTRAASLLEEFGLTGRTHFSPTKLSGPDPNRWTG